MLYASQSNRVLFCPMCGHENRNNVGEVVLEEQTARAITVAGVRVTLRLQSFLLGVSKLGHAFRPNTLSERRRFAHNYEVREAQALGLIKHVSKRRYARTDLGERVISHLEAIAPAGPAGHS